MTDKPEAMEEDFGAMFEASIKKKRRVFQPGEKVTGTVMTVGKDRLLLDLGDGQDGMIELNELGDPENRPVIKVGDPVEGFVLGVVSRVVELGLKAGRGGGGRYQLEEAQRTGLPVEGVVSEVNKGGYVVEVGGTRCFCPLGSMDVRRIEDPATMVGQKLLFRVTEMKSSRDVVLSRRAILEEENARKAVETRRKLVVGAQLRGTVVGVKDFGAFVDLGGVEGMVPASELSYGRARPQDVVHVGQQVDVEVVRMEPGKDGKERISLSMKAMAEDPFDLITAQLPEGTVVVGRVTRVQPFGAFVELAPGVEGLLHVSAFGKRVGHPSEVVKPEQAIAVRVDHVDSDARRLSLHYVDAKELEARGWVLGADTKGALRILGRMEVAAGQLVNPEPAAAASERAPRQRAPQGNIGDIYDVTVDKVETFGVFVSWATGRGLVPGSELGVPRNADLKRSFPVGTQFKASVVDIRSDGKLKLSKTAVEHAEERAEMEAYQRSSAPVSGKGFGTLGDLLKARSSK